MTPILELAHVYKTYQSTRAVDDVSFTMPKGSIFGLLGPNGAGKTSLIRIITAITRADQGIVRIDGEILHAGHPEHIGYMPEERGLYKKMKVGDHLLYLARLKGLTAREARQAIDEWMSKFDIVDWWDKKVEELSKGMQQKIQFIATVVHRPGLIILDEPFSGLDPINARLIQDEIHRLRDEGSSIIFSTHRMEQVEEICERIVLINQGRNVLEGPVGEIRQARKEHLYRFGFRGELPAALRERVTLREEGPGYIVLHFAEESEARQYLRALLDQGVPLSDFQEILPSLNDIFIRTVAEQAAAGRGNQTIEA